MTAIKVCLLFCLCFSLVLCQTGYQRYQENQYENRNYNRGNYGYRDNQAGYGRNIYNVIPDVVRQVSNSWQIFPSTQSRPNNYNQYPNNNYQQPNYNTYHYHDPNFYQNNNNFQNPNYQNQYPNNYPNPQNQNYPNNQEVPNFDVRFPENIGYNTPQENNQVNPPSDETSETPYVFPDDNGEAEVNNNQNDGVRVVESSDYQVTPSTQPTESTTTQGLVQPNFESRNMFFSEFSPSCRSPDKRPGSCISLLHCKEYLDLLQYNQNPTIVNILRKAACGFEGRTPKVCCPAKPIPTEIITAAPEPQPPTTLATLEPVEPGQPKSADNIYIKKLPEPPVCGVSGGQFSRVVNGVPAKLGLFPWMALLGYQGRKDPNVPRWLCGGSLISEKHVLTAAHCMNGRNDLYQVRLGELDLAREDDGATPIDILIKTKFEHQNYNPQAFTDDIGILVLEKDVEFTSLIRPLCIPQTPTVRSMDFVSSTPFLAGWGDTEFRGPSATHLQMTQLPVVTNEQCARAYASYKKQVIDERVLCAGYEEGGKDACQGDSGGPLMQPIFNGTTFNFYQIGVVSYGKKCAEAGFPGVYSRVTHFMPWILEIVTGRAL